MEVYFAIAAYVGGAVLSVFAAKRLLETIVFLRVSQTAAFVVRLAVALDSTGR